MAGITLTEPTSAFDISDVDFLKQIDWAGDADASVVSAVKAGDLKAFWAALTKSEFGLGSRARRHKVQERRTTPAMSLWSRACFSETPLEFRLAEIWVSLSERLQAAYDKAADHQARKKNKANAAKNGKADSAVLKIPRKLLGGLADYLEAAEGQPASAWELLLLTELLRHAGKSLPSKVGVPLWRRIVTAAIQCGQAGSHEDSDPNRNIKAGELPWVLGLFLANLKGAKTLRQRGQSLLQAELEDHTDTDGTVRAEETEKLTEWLPPFVRAAEWAYAAETPLWNADGQERFSYVANRAAALFAGDGHLAFHSPEHPFALPLLLAAARSAGVAKKDWPLKFLLDVAEERPELLDGKKTSKHGHKLKTSRRKLPEVDEDSFVQQSDWARTACLRNHAGPDADLLAVTHHQILPRIDLSILGHGILQGPWELEVAYDGTPLEPPFKWSCVCWHTDGDGDYLELQHTIDENRRIERQVFLSRTDHFLVMADCLSGAGDAVIDYVARWPLVAGAEVQRSDNSRECVVSLGDVQMRTFPLALPEQIAYSTPGKWGLAESRGTPCLELRQKSQGGLYAPVVFDWTPARQSTRADWRTLTITENGPKVDVSRAAGHRLRIGNQQILIYRSLAPGELRTVLGHHTGHETVIARFNKNGDVKPLLIVE